MTRTGHLDKKPVCGQYAGFAQYTWRGRWWEILVCNLVMYTHTYIVMLVKNVSRQHVFRAGRVCTGLSGEKRLSELWVPACCIVDSPSTVRLKHLDFSRTKGRRRGVPR